MKLEVIIVGDLIHFRKSYKKGRIHMDNIHDVAEYLLSKDSMTHKKLQKLCYYVQAWSLALTGIPLMNTDFEAWIHGPVSPELYREYRDWGWVDIPKRRKATRISKKGQDFADKIYSIYGDMTGDQLENLTHSEAPWKNARRGLKAWENCTNIIPDDHMEDFYRKILKG